MGLLAKDSCVHDHIFFLWLCSTWFLICCKKKNQQQKKQENKMVAISCTVLIEECPSPFEDSLTVFALQVRLLEDENLRCLWLIFVTPFPHPCWWFCSKESKRSIGNALCSLAHSAARLADCYSQACSILPFLRLSQGDSFSFNHFFFILETLIAPVIHK